MTAVAGAVLGASSATYALALWWPAHGFDVSLVAHVLLTTALSVRLLVTSDPQTRGKMAVPFVAALLCCLGFAGLKLADHALAAWSPLFGSLTGHFWSKICDFLQIHFMAEFVLTRMRANERARFVR